MLLKTRLLAVVCRYTERDRYSIQWISNNREARFQVILFAGHKTVVRLFIVIWRRAILEEALLTLLSSLEARKGPSQNLKRSQQNKQQEAARTEEV